MTRPGTSERVRDALIFVAVLFATGGAFLWTGQPRAYGDGVWMLASMSDSESSISALHPAYATAFRSFRALLPCLDALDAGRAMSSVAGALGCGCLFLLARGFGLSLRAALFATLFGIATPVVWFFATTIELHILSFAAAAAAAWVTLSLPWKRFWLSVSVSASCLALGYLCHQTVALLGPGWILLVANAHKRCTGQALGWRRGLGMLPLFAALPLLAMATIRWRNGEPFSLISHEASVFGAYTDSSQILAMLQYGWLLPLAFLLPAAAAGSLVRRNDDFPHLVPTLLVLIVPLVFVAGGLFTVPERGGYFACTIPFLAVLAGRAFCQGSPARNWVVALLIAQAAWAFHRIHDYNSRFRIDDRTRIVEAVIGSEGLLVSGEHLVPYISNFLPNVTELSLLKPIRKAYIEERTPEAFAIGSCAILRQCIAEGPVALDLSFELRAERRSESLKNELELRAPFLDALVRQVDLTFETQRFDDDSWPMLRLDAVRAAQKE